MKIPVPTHTHMHTHIQSRTLACVQTYTYAQPNDRHRLTTEHIRSVTHTHTNKHTHTNTYTVASGTSRKIDCSLLLYWKIIAHKRTATQRTRESVRFCICAETRRETRIHLHSVAVHRRLAKSLSIRPIGALEKLWNRRSLRIY